MIMPQNVDANSSGLRLIIQLHLYYCFIKFISKYSSQLFCSHALVISEIQSNK
jgi:hypothetical protein